MEFGCPKPGTTFAFDSGTSMTAHGQDGMDCVMQKVGGPAVKVRALLFDNPGPDGKDTSAFIAAIKPERLWPLAVGKKIEASYSAGGQTWSYVLNVARFEKRMGPDDALFDAFVIEMNEQGDKGYRSISRWWVSPGGELRAALRFQQQQRQRQPRHRHHHQALGLSQRRPAARPEISTPGGPERHGRGR